MIKESIGQANTILVSPEGQGIVTAIHAKKVKRKNTGSLIFNGVVQFEPSVQLHLEKIVLPLVDEILTALDIQPSDFELSARNIGAAATSDLGLTISGFSSDVPVFMALLSVALKLSVSQDMAFTGHIGSTRGAILPVSSLDKKVKAALDDDRIKEFVYPELDSDRSVSRLKPIEFKEAEAALRSARGRLKLQDVDDTNTLLTKSLSVEALVQAALYNGYFQVGKENSVDNTTLPAAQFLAEANDKRFWEVVSDLLFAKAIKEAQEILKTFTKYHIAHKQYPARFGDTLYHLIISLPALIRRHPDFSALLDKELYIKLIQYAVKVDHSDISLLHEALYGSLRILRKEEKKVIEDNKTNKDVDPILDHLLNELNFEFIETNVKQPFNEAYVRYSADGNQVESHEEFLDAIIAFYAHIARQTSGINKSADKTTLTAEAIALCERTFSQEKGFKGALSEAIHPSRGGLKYIFDKIVNQLKQEAWEKHVLKTFKETINPLDFSQKTKLITEIIKRGREYLPEEIISQPPERYAEDYEEIITVFARSQTILSELLRRL